MPTRSHVHPVFARLYIRASELMDRGGGAELRSELLAGLAGNIVEVGAGNGRNFARYPVSVSSVLAVEPEPTLRRAAEVAASKASASKASGPITVVEGVADRLPAEDNTMDAVVMSLVLCSVHDQAAALSEARRVLRPGGELRFYEHVQAPSPGLLRRSQYLFDATFWPKMAAGCHCSRDTLSAIQTAGFTVTQVKRFRLPQSGPVLPMSPHIIGRAIS